MQSYPSVVSVKYTAAAGGTVPVDVTHFVVVGDVNLNAMKIEVHRHVIPLQNVSSPSSRLKRQTLRQNCNENFLIKV